MINEKHGHLTVKDILGCSFGLGSTGLVLDCICDCGKSRAVTERHLHARTIISCGCKTRPIKTHGASHRSSPLRKTYSSWQNMKSRCLNPIGRDYDAYGGRGISIQQSWVESFETFVADMGECPENMSLDRIDVNGDYTVNNCRWASHHQQAVNKRKLPSNTSGRTGVYMHHSGNWQAKMRINGKWKSIGNFADFQEACKAREAAELKYYNQIKE